MKREEFDAHAATPFVASAQQQTVFFRRSSKF
jgi:hypothetical protein